MGDTKKWINECISSLDELYELAIAENFAGVQTKFMELSEYLQQFYEEVEVDATVLQINELIKKLYKALEKGDFVRLVDVAKYEIQPLFIHYLESMGA
jgi:hypothetical protein